MSSQTKNTAGQQDDRKEIISLLEDEKTESSDDEVDMMFGVPLFARQVAAEREDDCKIPQFYYEGDEDKLVHQSTKKRRKKRKPAKDDLYVEKALEETREEDEDKLVHQSTKKRRKKRKSAKDDPCVEKALKEAGNTTWDDRLWEHAYQRLLKFQRREGHCNVPYTHREDDWALGCWISDQRKRRKAGKLDRYREKRLEESGMAWDLKEWRFNMRCRLLLKFYKRHGHCNVPLTHRVEGISLYKWIKKMRHEKKCGNLHPDHEKRITDIGVILNPIPEQWEDNYELLVKFKQREGHCNVHRRHEEDGYLLGNWLNSQKYKRLHKLDSNHKKRLTALGVSL